MKYSSLENLKIKHSENCTAKSENEIILTLYSYILDKQKVDSDWWREGHGCDDVICYVERTFSDFEWNLLEEDIENWTSDQIELFILSILTGRSGHGIGEDINVRYLQMEYTLHKRADFLLKINFFERIHDLISLSYMDYEIIIYYQNLNSSRKNSDKMMLMKKLIEKFSKESM